MSEDTGSKSGNDGGDQLISFFLYSFVFYPVSSLLLVNILQTKIFTLYLLINKKRWRIT